MKHIFFSFQKTRTDFNIETSNNLDEKANFLNIDGKGKLGILSGLISVEGSASFLKDGKKTNKIASVTMHYKFEDRFEELPSELIQKPDLIPHDFENTKGTHVVIGIQYGANVFFEFEKKINENKSKQDIAGGVKAQVNKIPKVTISLEGSFKMKDEEKKIVEGVRCKFVVCF